MAWNDVGNLEGPAEMPPKSDFFIDIRNLLESDPSVHSLDEMNFLFRSSWIDPFFQLNRQTRSVSPHFWRAEEFALLEEMKLLSNGTEFSETETRIFAMVTGRNPLDLHQSHPDLFPEIELVDIPTQDPEFVLGPSLITPSLLFKSVFRNVQMPFVSWKNGFSQISSSELQKILNLNIQSSFLSFHNSILLKGIVTRYPLSDGTFWTSVRCEPFAVSFGDDISDSISPIKYSWVNSVSDDCPPTLTNKNGIKLSTYINRNRKENEDDVEEKIIDPVPELEKWCPVSHPQDYQDLFMKYITTLEASMKHIIPIWINPENGLCLPDEPEDGKLVLIECASFCQCGGHCQYCILDKNASRDLALFYSDKKQWGVLATKDIPKGSLITEYCGQCFLNRVSGNPNFFFAVEFGDFEAGLAIDAEKYCNIARFINTTCPFLEPDHKFCHSNAFSLNVISSSHETTRIAIFALRDIYAGEEIDFNYGDSYKVPDCACHSCIRKKHH